MRMAERKKDFDYFEYFCICADYICSAAEFLDSFITDFKYEVLYDKLMEMHKIENDADLTKHEMTKALTH